MPAKRSALILLGVASALLLLSFLFVQFGLPEIFESQLRNRLESSGIQTDTLSIDKLGMNDLEASSTSLKFADTAVSIEQVNVSWTYPEVFNKHISYIALDAIELDLKLDDILAAFVIASDETEIQRLNGAETIEREERKIEIGRESGTQAVEFDSFPAVENQKSNLFELPLSVDELRVKDGQINFAFDTYSSSFQWDAILMLGEFSEGRLSFSGQSFVADFYASHRSQRSFIGSFSMDGSDLAGTPLTTGIVDRLSGYEISYEFGEVQLDGIFEYHETEDSLLSFDLSLSDVSFSVGENQFPELDTFVLAGGYLGSKISLYAGIRAKEGVYQDFHYSGLALKGNATNGSYSLESEVFEWNRFGLSGTSAVQLMGSYDSVSMRFQLPNVQIAANELIFAGYKVEPFGIQLEYLNNEYEWDVSEIAFKGIDNVNFSNISGVYDIAEAAVSGALNLSLNKGDVGSIEFGGSLKDLGSEFSGVWTAASRESLGQVHYKEESDFESLKLFGTLDEGWLSAILALATSEDIYVPSGEVKLNIDLERMDKGANGTIELELDGLDLAISDSMEARFVSGDVDFEIIRSLPRNRGTQVLFADEINVGGMSVKAVTASFAMPYIGLFQLEELHGIAFGGDIWVEPFSFRFLDTPEFETQLRIQGVDSGQLLKLLGEERIEIAGRMSGFLPISWRDGIATIGSGELRMEAGSANRLVIKDPSILADQLGFESDPLKLGERLLRALSIEGMQISTLLIKLFPESSSEDLLIRFEFSGKVEASDLTIPIKGFVINNYISADDLTWLLDLGNWATVVIDPTKR